MQFEEKSNLEIITTLNLGLLLFPSIWTDGLSRQTRSVLVANS